MTGRLSTLMRRTATTPVTVALLGWLGAAVLAGELQGGVTAIQVLPPLVVLALQLALAIALHPALRRGGLGVFHVALLTCLVLAAWGRLHHLDARVEVAEGADFDPSLVQVQSQGPWYDRSRLHALAFEQGRFEIAYAAGVRRGPTRSQVHSGGQAQTVGDDRPLVLDGHRFYTTHNKGFAPLLRWAAPGAAPVQGAVHMPSYPLQEGQQQQQWQPPGAAEPLRLWLQPDRPLPADQPFTLAMAAQGATLVVQVQGQRFELRPGQAARGSFGELHYVRLLGWMGWRITHDPSMAALFWTALVAVLGLAWHLWPRGERAAASQPQGATWA